MQGLAYEDPVLEVMSKVEGNAALVEIDSSGLAYEVSNLDLDHGNVTLQYPRCNSVWASPDMDSYLKSRSYVF